MRVVSVRCGGFLYQQASNLYRNPVMEVDIRSQTVQLKSSTVCDARVGNAATKPIELHVHLDCKTPRG